jgi:hypothetical protein
MSDVTLETLVRTLAAIEKRLEHVVTRVDRIPFMDAAIGELRRNVRGLITTMNDVAGLQPTTGEVVALHDDVDKALASDIEQSTEIAALKRHMKELQARVEELKGPDVVPPGLSISARSMYGDGP